MPLLPGYSQQRQIVIDNGGPGAAVMSASGNCLVAVQVPTDWALLGSFNDLRVVRSLDGGVTGTEVARQIVNNGPFLNPTGTQAAVFNLVVDIAAGARDTTYWLVGVNAGAGAPPTTLTTDTTGRLEDFEDNSFQQFLHAHGNGTLDTARFFAGAQSLKLALNGNGCFVTQLVYFWGTGLDFYWSTDTANANNHLAYHIDNGNTTPYTVVGFGSNAFGGGNHVTISGLSNSLHRVEFFAHSGDGVVAGANAVWIDNLTVNGCPVVYAPASSPAASTGIQSFSYTVPFGNTLKQAFSYNLVAPVVTLCWEPYTQRLLDYLAPDVFRAKVDNNSLLHQVFSMVARELTLCTETVTLTNSSDARGDGSFHVHVRFQPVLSVPLVERVDANGSVLETYTVTAIQDRTITLTGTTPPKAGDNLIVSYTYTHKGLEFCVREALLQLNILTSTGDFLDTWGQWFGVPRNLTGTYGSASYGSGLYGVPGAEDDAHFSRRIIDRVLQSRNTKVAIIAAVQTATGGSPYIVEWIDPGNPVGFIFNVTGQPTWDGTETAAALSKHLIMGRTARFRNGAVPGGGAYVFEVWVPQGSGYSAPALLEIVNAYKAAGTRAFIRFQGT